MYINYRYYWASAQILPGLDVGYPRSQTAATPRSASPSALTKARRGTFRRGGGGQGGRWAVPM
ncbi:MAG TPA: hypothetical protein VGY54_16660, partial [Polyangiaceae bacterium]|nr:hypothetical protein [Polyangiaceae bacterium]